MLHPRLPCAQAWGSCHAAMLLHGGMTEGGITNSPTKANDLQFTAYPLRPGFAGPPPPPRISVEGEARVLPHQCFFRDNDVEVFTRSFCLRCVGRTPREGCPYIYVSKCAKKAPGSEEPGVLGY